jgi:hypothetical protein
VIRDFNRRSLPSASRACPAPLMFRAGFQRSEDRFSVFYLDG